MDGVHARGRGRPQERDRHRVHGRPRAPEAGRGVHRRGDRGGALRVRLHAPEARHARLSHEQRYRVTQHHRPQRPLDPEARRRVEAEGDEGGAVAARHRCQGWTRLRELLERRPRDPRRGQRDQGGHAVRPEARQQLSVQRRSALPGCDGGLRAGVHQWHAHGVAAQELRLHCRRGVPAGRADRYVGRGIDSRLRPPPGDRRERYRASKVRGVVRARVRRRA